MKSTRENFIGKTCLQVVVDRYYRHGKPPDPIKGRILKDWNDRMPNWQPNSQGEYTNDYFYGGNLRGLEEKLPYIKSMGFDMIYVSPLDKSEEYHHYDVGDQSKIDPWLGDWDDFAKLCNTAEQIGISIIVDVVFNHTSWHSVYYDNLDKYGHWYKKDANGNPVLWYGFNTLREIDTSNPDYRREMKKVLRKYIICGASGFRFDLGENLAREFFMDMATLKEEFPYIIFIAEMWGIATDKDDPKIFDGQVDSVMNYPISDGILRWCAFGNYQHFKHNYRRVYSEYPVVVQNVLLNNVATHDTPLTMTMLADIKLSGSNPVMNPDVYNGQIWDIEGPWRSSRGFDTYGFRLFEAEHDRLTQNQYELASHLTKVALAIMYFVPGIPCVMQGVEIGDSGFKDPFCRKPYNWDSPDKEIQTFVSALGKIRKENLDVLAEGGSNLAICDEDVVILERFDYKGHRLVLAVSRSCYYKPISIINDCNELKVIYATGDSTKNKLDPYGILIAREN